MQVARYDKADAEAWDALVDSSSSTTFQHSRRFLDYHGERFRDASLTFRDNGRLIAVWPAAAGGQGEVVSHPGAVHGGLVASDKLVRAGRVEEVVVEALRSWSVDFDRYVHKTVPHALVPVVEETSEYWLRRNGATTTRCDLWNVLSLNSTARRGSGIKDNLRIARKAGLRAARLTSVDVDDFYQLLASCLDERHDATPVHSEMEVADLQHRLGDRQTLWGARNAEGNLLAATWVFHYTNASHTQYIASTSDGRRQGAPAAVIAAAVDHCRERGDQYLSFGASTTEAGRVLNAGLFRFKAGFGAAGLLHRHLTLELKHMTVHR